MSNCIFCKIIAGEIPSTRVYEDEHTIVIMDIHPASIGHMLVIPRTHAALVHELSAEAAGHVMKTAQKVEQALRKSELGVTASNLWINNGADAGQEVAHVHLHVVPRYPADGIRTQVPNRPKQQLDFADIAQKISINL